MARTIFSRLRIAFALIALGPLACLAQTVTFNLPAQPLAESLKAVGAQANVNVMVAPLLVDGKQAPALKANLSVKDALVKLLSGTGLEHHFVNDQTVVIREKSAVAIVSDPPTAQSSASIAPDNQKEAGKNSSQDFRVAEMDQALAGPEVGSPDPKRKDEPALTEIVVTGTHIRGAAPVGAQLTQYTREDIEQSGSATVDQFARQMTENFSGVDPIANNSSTANLGRFAADTINNAFGGAAFDLHGVGAQYTLTLLNGHRLAPAGLSGSFADVSQIAVSAIDHIDVLPDGASAIYGSDAVAGVVNIVTRRDFDGAETGVRYGAATAGGVGEITASQLLGKSWSSGNVLASYEYDKQDGLYTSQRTWLPNQGGPQSLIPSSRRNSFLLSGSQQLGTDSRVTLDLLYSDHRSDTQTFANNTVADYIDATNTPSTAKQTTASLSVDQSLRGDWHADAGLNYSKVTQQLNLVDTFTAAGTEPAITPIGQSANSNAVELDANATGSLFSMPAGSIRVAVGGSFRREEFQQADTFSGIQQLIVPTARRHVTSGYAELAIPLISQANALPGIRSLQLSAAGRYDDYSDFGSSTNPKLGVLWEPVSGLDVRITYGKSFRAPLLSELSVATQSAGTDLLADPMSPTGSTDTLLLSGGSPALKPETSKSFSAGFDVKPQFLENLSVTASYFHISFTDRIATPPYRDSPLIDPTVAAYLQRNPPLGEVEGYFNSPGFFDGAGGGPTAVRALFNDMLANIASTKQSGVDVKASYAVPTNLGRFTPSLSATRLLNYSYQAIAATAPFDVLNQFAEPLKWKARANIAWSRGPFSAVVSVNHVNSYDNTLVIPSERISSWTTGDVFVSYRTGQNGVSHFMHDLTLSLSLLNFTNRQPPYVAISVPAGISPIPFDPVNASPIGRLVALRIIKGW